MLGALAGIAGHALKANLGGIKRAVGLAPKKQPAPAPVPATAQPGATSAAQLLHELIPRRTAHTAPVAAARDRKLWIAGGIAAGALVLVLLVVLVVKKS